MDKVIRRYLVPLGILIIGSFILNLLNRYLPQIFGGNVYYFFHVVMLFSFGMSLNFSKSKLSGFSLRHIVIVVLLIFLFLYDINLIPLNIFSNFLAYINYGNYILAIFYVYLGTLFNER